MFLRQRSMVSRTSSSSLHITLTNETKAQGLVERLMSEVKTVTLLRTCKNPLFTQKISPVHLLQDHLIVYSATTNAALEPQRTYRGHERAMDTTRHTGYSQAWSIFTNSTT
jgi:hypothetical protein